MRARGARISQATWWSKYLWHTFEGYEDMLETAYVLTLLFTLFLVGGGLGFEFLGAIGLVLGLFAVVILLVIFCALGEMADKRREMADKRRERHEKEMQLQRMKFEQRRARIRKQLEAEFPILLGK